MAELHLAGNLVELRKKMGITQEVLADFIGVSKASVSKWETGQSFPDIATLPRLASYFNCSIDELMGYEAQLDRKHIRKIYFMLAEEFATKPFEEAYKDVVKWSKEYYSCYPFLQQIAILLANHYMLTPDKKRQKDVIEYAISLCKRICRNSDDVLLCRDALTVQGMFTMVNGNPKETLELLGDEIVPYMGTDELIAQAYQMTGEIEKAVQTIQVSMYQKLASILQMGTGFLINTADSKEKTKEIINRMQAVIDAFDWEQVNPGNTFSFYYQAAVVLCAQKDYEGAIQKLQQYTNTAKKFKAQPDLHGDSFFDQVDTWIEQFELGGKMACEKSVVMASLKQLFENSAFGPLEGYKEFKLLKKEVESLGKGE